MSVSEVVIQQCENYGNDPNRLMDILRGIQSENHCIESDTMEEIASCLGIHRVEVESTASFYSFFSKDKQGQIVIRLCDDIIDEMKGAEDVAAALTEALGIDFGGTTDDGMFTLEYTPCIGMCDQAPAAMINDTIVTELDAGKARRIVEALKNNPDPQALIEEPGDGNNAHPLVRAEVKNNIRLAGEAIFGEYEEGSGLKSALAGSDEDVLKTILESRLRGRGGAGFPTGMKWDFTRKAEGDRKFVVCNADEGEPGTFKDRVILTERPGMVFEGMAIAGFAAGASEGIIYLRAEYAYLRQFLEDVLKDYRKKGLLGENIAGSGLNFDIRIQMGAGAYVCGEETSLLSSCEGRAGDPKTRPPFPVQKGYMDFPTTVNNVETFAAATRIMEKGAAWFAGLGGKHSSGTKLLSVSGDCENPGVYEVPFGIPLSSFLQMCGGTDAAAVQVGGASGQMIGPDGFEREICFEDLGTGGSIMVFNESRDILEIAATFVDFFIEESCGYCTPCRAGTVLIRQYLERFLDGTATEEDLDILKQLGKTVKTTSRCGLGQTAANPALTTIQNFPSRYSAGICQTTEGGQQPTFDIARALGDAEAIAGRSSEHFS